MPHCSVLGCSVSSGNKDNIKIFSFPKKDEELRKKWIEKLRRPHGWEPTRNSCVCALHFVDQDRKLHPIPTLNLGYRIKSSKDQAPTKTVITPKKKGRHQEEPRNSDAEEQQAQSIEGEPIDVGSSVQGSRRSSPIKVPSSKTSTASDILSSLVQQGLPASVGTTSHQLRKPSLAQISPVRQLSASLGRVFYSKGGIRAKEKTPKKAAAVEPYHDPTNPETPIRRKAKGLQLENFDEAAAMDELQREEQQEKSPKKKKRRRRLELSGEKESPKKKRQKLHASDIEPLPEQQDDEAVAPFLQPFEPGTAAAAMSSASPSTTTLLDEQVTDLDSAISEAVKSLAPKRLVSLGSLSDKERMKLLLKFRQKSHREEEKRKRADELRLQAEAEKNFGWHKILNDDEATNMWTGFPNYGVMQRLFDNYLIKDAGKLSLKSKTQSQRKRKRMLPLEDEFLLTCMRLRANLGNKKLAHLFGIKRRYVTSILHAWIPFLAKKLGVFVDWIPRHERLQLPKAFWNYPKAVAIIDCFELQAEKPAKTVFRQRMWSDYKQRYTAKFLVVISPNGTIMYLSRAWTGRASDRAVVMGSQPFLDSLEPYDEVLADRGFNIGTYLYLNHRVQLRIPPFKKRQNTEDGDEDEGGQSDEEDEEDAGKKKKKSKKKKKEYFQFSRREVVSTRNLASARVHVERCIGHLRNFRILAERFSALLFPFIDDIAIICAAICNMHPPLVS